MTASAPGSDDVPPDDPSPADTIAALSSALRRHGTVLELDLTPLDRLGLPVSDATLLAGSRLTHHGDGYGSTPAAARTGALGELVERVVGRAGVARRRRTAEQGSRRELVARHGEDGVVDPRTLALPAGADWSEERPLHWLALSDVRSGAPVRVPLELVASDASELGDLADPLLPPVTNGLGAGLDPARALAHGLGEVLQRHLDGLRFRSLDRLSPVVAEDGLPAPVNDLLARMRAAGIDPVLKHAATELGVCAVYAVAHDPDPPSKIAVTACGEAADPDPAAAMTKALLELAHSRARKAFCFGDQRRALALAAGAYADHLAPVVGDERAAAEMRRWAGLSTAELAGLVAPDTSRTTTYDALLPHGTPPAARTPAAALAHLLDRLEGHDVLAATTQEDGVVVAKVLVTGLDVETLSHGRVGESGVRVSLEHDLDLVRLADGPAGEHRHRVHLTPAAEERVGGPAWFSYAAAERVVGRQYPQYREPGRHSVEV